MWTVSGAEKQLHYDPILTVDIFVCTLSYGEERMEVLLPFYVFDDVSAFHIFELNLPEKTSMLELDWNPVLIHP